MTTENIVINIREDGARVVTVNINNIGRAADDAATSVTGLNQALELFKKAWNTVSGFADKFFEMADAVTQLDSRLRLVTKSAQDYVRAQEDIYRISQANNTGLKETGSLYTKLYDPVMRLGGGAKEVGGIVEAFTATLKIGGASATEAASSVLQFAQAMGSGKLAGDEFRSLAENSPRFLQVLADALDVPTGALKGLASQGKLTSDVIANALLKDLDKLRAEAVGVGQTVSGAFSDLNNDATRTVGWFDKLTGASQGFAQQIEGVSLLLFQLGKVFKDEVADGTKVATSGFDLMAVSMRVIGTVLETILLLSSDVVYVFKGIGREIGGIAAQFAAVLSGNFKDVATIRGQMIEDSKNAESELKRYQDRIANITNNALAARNKMNEGPGSDDMVTLKAAASEKDLLEARMRLAGITKNYLNDLSALYKSYEDGKLNQAEYVGLVNELAVKTYAASTAGKELAKSNKDNEKLNRQYDQSFGSLIESIAEKDAVLKLSLTSEDKLTAAEKMAAKVMEDMKNGTLGLVAARGMSIDQQKRIIAAKLEEYILDDRNVTLQKAEDKANEKSLKDLDDEIEKMQAKADKQFEANDLIGKTREEIDNLKSIRLLDSAASDLQMASGMRLNAIYSPESQKAIEEYANKLEKLAKAKRELAGGLAVGADEEAEKAQDAAMKKAAKKYEEEFNRASKSIQDGLYKAISEGGGSAFKKLLADAKSWFARLVLNPIIKPIGDFGASLLTGGTASGDGGAGSSLMSMFSQGSSLFSIGKTIYNGFAAGIGTSLGTIVSAAGNLFGSTAISSFGAGMGMTTAQATTAAAAYNAAVAEGTISASAGTAAAGGISAGASASAAIPIIGWIIAGMAAADGFRKEGFTANNGTITNPLAKAFTAPTNFANTTMKALGFNDTVSNILSGASVNTKLFGRADPRVESSGIRGTVYSDDLIGKSYANIVEKGGLFRSSKRYTNEADLSETADKAFDDTLKGIVANVKTFANVLGNDGSGLNGFSKQFDIKMTGNQESDDAAIVKFFSDLSDEFANKLVPSLKDFTAEGETATQTLTRVSSNYAGVQALVVSLGSTMQKAFGAVGEAALKSSEQLIKAAGGLEQLDTITSFFSQNFLSAADQLAPVQKSLTEQLTKLGYGAITTAEQYTQAVIDLTNSGKLATKEGAETYVALLALGPAFKQVTDAIKATTDAALESARAFADTAFKALSKSIDDLKSKAEAVYNAQSAIITAQASSAAAMYDKQIEAAQASLDAAKTLQSSLTSTLSSMTPAGDIIGNRQAAASQISAALAIAKSTGVLPTAESLADALRIAGTSDESAFATRADYNRDYYVTAGQINDLNNLAGDKVDTATLALDVATKAKEAAEIYYQKSLDALKAEYDAQIAQYDSILTLAQSQLDVANGSYLALLSIGDALNGFNSAISAALAASTAAGQAPVPGAPTAPITNPTKTSSSDEITNLYRTLLGREPDAEGLKFWTDAAKNYNMSTTDIAYDFLQSDEYLKSHSHANGGIASGWSIVGERGPEMVNFSNPSRVYTAAQTSGMFGGGGTNWSEVVDAIMSLHSGLEQIFEEVKRGADGSEKAGDALYKNSGGGGPLQTTSVD